MCIDWKGRDNDWTRSRIFVLSKLAEEVRRLPISACTPFIAHRHHLYLAVIVACPAHRPPHPPPHTRTNQLKAYDVKGGVRVMIGHEAPFFGSPQEISVNADTDESKSIVPAPLDHVPKYSGLRSSGADMEFDDWNDDHSFSAKRAAWLAGGTPPPWDAPKVPLSAAECSELLMAQKPWERPNIMTGVVKSPEAMLKLQEALHPWHKGAKVIIYGLTSDAGKLLNGKEGILKEGLPGGVFKANGSMDNEYMSQRKPVLIEGLLKSIKLACWAHARCHPSPKSRAQTTTLTN